MLEFCQQRIEQQMIIIEANSNNSRYIRDIWDYRELVYFLAWKDILVRYKQTSIGLAWAVIRPLLVMVALCLVFGKFVNLATEQTVPYPLLVLSGVIPWLYFSNTLGECSESIVSNANLVTKIYFPRVIIPIGSSIVAMVDMLITLGLLGLMLAWFHYPLSLNILFLPFFIMLCFMLAFGMGLWVSALNVRFRDFRYVIPFALQFGVLATPVGFSSSIAPVQWKVWFGLNPLVGIIDGFRWCILGSSQPIYWPTLMLSVLISSAILATGILYFRSVEKTFADII